MMEERLGKINKDIATLADIVKATEKQMRTDNAVFLQVGSHGHFLIQHGSTL